MNEEIEREIRQERERETDALIEFLNRKFPLKD